MARCSRCGRSGLTLKLDSRGDCLECQQTAIREDADRAMRQTQAEAEKILSAARAEAARLIVQAQAEADRIIEDAQSQCAGLLDGVQAELAQTTARLEASRQDVAAVIAQAHEQLAALYASAGRDFAHTARVKAVAGVKPGLKTLTPLQFKKAARDGYVVFDLETTGLDCRWERIIEIGAIKYGPRGAELDRYQTLVRPDKPIPAAATQINGITDAMVADAPEISNALPAFFDFCAGLPIIAHNAAFDISFLRAAAERCGIAYALECGDSLSMAKKSIEGLKSYRLCAVAEHIGVRTGTAHRAMGDCETLGGVVRSLLDL